MGISMHQVTHEKRNHYHIRDSLKEIPTPSARNDVPILKQKKSSLILRKAKFQTIFEFVLSSASGGAGGGKYILNFLKSGRSLEKFFQKNFRDDNEGICDDFFHIKKYPQVLVKNIEKNCIK